MSEQELEPIVISNCPTCNHFPTQFIDGVGLKALDTHKDFITLRDENARLREVVEQCMERFTEYHDYEYQTRCDNALDGR